MVNTRLRRSGPLLGLVLTGVAAAALGFGVLAHARTRILSLRYRLCALQSREASLLGEVEKLRLQAAALASPGQIEPKALALGLRYPESGQRVRLADVARETPR